MKKINLRKSIIVILSVTIVLLTIGFITISVKYHGLKEKETSFNVEFTKIKKVSSSKGSNKEPSGSIDIKNNSKELDLSFNLYHPKDEMLYEITLKNTGTINVEIIDLLMSPDYVKGNKNLISPVKMTLTDISGKILEPGEESVIKLNVVYSDTKNIEQKNIKGKIGIIASHQ